jgi:hypothetical protein
MLCRLWWTMACLEVGLWSEQWLSLNGMQVLVADLSSPLYKLVLRT